MPEYTNLQIFLDCVFAAIVGTIVGTIAGLLAELLLFNL